MGATIAIFGGTGAIGQSVASALREQQKPYRIVARSRASMAKLFGSDPLAELVVWDPNDAESIRVAASGIDTIVYTVGLPYTEFRLHPILMRRTLDAAIAAGVARILHIANVYPYGIPETIPVREDHPRNPNTFKGRMRKEQEDALLEADAAGKIRGAILRLPDFYGPSVVNSFMYNVFHAAAHGGAAQLIGPIDKVHEYVFVPDVGPVVVKLAAEPRAYGKWWHFGAAGRITQREFAERIFAQAGRKPKFFVAGRVMLRFFGLFNPFLRELVEMHYLVTNPVILDDSAIRELLGPLHKTTYEEGIRQTLAVMQAAPSGAQPSPA